jgi:hypothetical protein
MARSGGDRRAFGRPEGAVQGLRTPLRGCCLQYMNPYRQEGPDVWRFHRIGWFFVPAFGREHKELWYPQGAGWRTLSAAKWDALAE